MIERFCKELDCALSHRLNPHPGVSVSGNEDDRDVAFGNHGRLPVVFLAWQHPRVAELGRTRGYSFAGWCASKPTSQKANRAHDPQPASHSNFPVIDDFGRLRPRPDCGHTWAGRLDCRWTARRSGEAGTETNHAAGQDEKIGYLAAYLSGRSQRSRGRAGRCPDLRVGLAATHGIKLEVSKRERLERQAVIDPVPALFVCVLPDGSLEFERIVVTPCGASSVASAIRLRSRCLARRERAGRIPALSTAAPFHHLWPSDTALSQHHYGSPINRAPDRP